MLSTLHVRSAVATLTIYPIGCLALQLNHGRRWGQNLKFLSEIAMAVRDHVGRILSEAVLQLVDILLRAGRGMQ